MLTSWEGPISSSQGGTSAQNDTIFTETAAVWGATLKQRSNRRTLMLGEKLDLMRWEIKRELPFNSYEYFERTLITGNGFREYDVRWLLGKEVNPNGFVVLGRGYGTFTRRLLKQNRVIVGHDFRAYSQDLCNAFILGLLSSGVDVIDIGLAISPMLYFAQHCFHSPAGAMITASHNENAWTGIKPANALSSTLGPGGIQTFRGIVSAV